MRTLDESAGMLLSAMSEMGGRAQRPARLYLGEVTAGGQEALQVRCNGLELRGEDLWINEALLEGYSPKLEGTLYGTCPDGQTVTPVTRDQLRRAEFALKPGDRLVLASDDEQSYTILCKAVSLA